jgi:hypothetical protein
MPPRRTSIRQSPRPHPGNDPQGTSNNLLSGTLKEIQPLELRTVVHPQQRQIPKQVQTQMKTSDAIVKVSELRTKGYSYTQISRELGFTKQRVGQIVEAHRNQSRWDHGLSQRNRSILKALDITDRFAAMLAIEENKLAPYKFRNYGRKSFTSLCQWLGIPVKPFSKSITCPKCQHHINLSSS